tara:strand:- start:141 stop:362 length:222 start_codon:yes stop_codon:yes gene_type:complete
MEFKYIKRYHGRLVPAWRVAVPYEGLTECGSTKKKWFTYIETVDFENPKVVPQSVLDKRDEFVKRPAHLSFKK